MCAECWAPKDEHARTFRRRPRTEALFDFDWESDFDWRVAGAAVLVLIAVVVRLVA